MRRPALVRIAAIGDVHGNGAALEAVPRDVDRVGSGLVISLGDHFSGPLDAAGTADLIAGREMPCIRGNHDRRLVECTRDGMLDRPLGKRRAGRSRIDYRGADIAGVARAPIRGARVFEGGASRETLGGPIGWILEPTCCSR